MTWYDSLPRPQFRTFLPVPVESRWYTVLKLPQNIYAICEPRHFQEVISFLILGKTAAILWDTGMGFSPILPVVKRLTSLPLIVINSHSHFDHTGGNDKFPSIWGWESASSRLRAERGWCPENGDDNFLPSAFAGDMVSVSAYSQNPYALRPLAQCQRFDLGDRLWEILYAPGHSDDSVVLFCEAEQFLCTGDTLYPGTLYAQEDPVGYARTLHMLCSRFSDYTLLCSHNEPIRTGDLLVSAQAAFDAMLGGKTSPTPAGNGLWLHTWKDIQILSRISG